MNQVTKSNIRCPKCGDLDQVIRVQWEDDCGGPTVLYDSPICLECGNHVNGSGCFISGETLENYRTKYGHVVSREGCVDQSLVRTRSVREITDCVVKYNCDQKTKDMLFDKMLSWFFEQEVFEGESIMQSDAPLEDAPILLCEIAEDIFDFDAIWEDEE